MVPRRVIEDSDGDDVSFMLSDPLSPPVITNESDAVPMIQPTSTDPTLFRSVYEQHFGPLFADDQLPNYKQSPIVGDSTDQRTSSSAPPARARKLKRAKTVESSSVNSIREPIVSNRKDKRVKLIRSFDDLTQITTPRKSNEAIQKDLWEVPTSSASEFSLDVHAKTKGRCVTTTYGRQIRRTPTAAQITNSSLTDQAQSSPPGDDMLRLVNQKNSTGSQEDDKLPISRLKRCKKWPSVNVDLPEPFRTEVFTIGKEAASVSYDTVQIGVDSTSAQVQRSTNEQTDTGTDQCAAESVNDFGSLSFTVQTNQEPTSADSYPNSESLAARATPKSLSSILIPNSLSDEQKLQYEIVSVSSTSQGRSSSQPEVVEAINLTVQNTKDTIMVSNVIPPSNSSPIMVQDGALVRLSSSPPVSLTNRKAKRAKSEVGSKRTATLSTSSHHNKGGRRQGRSKTISQGEKRHGHELSIDELSMPILEPLGKRACKERSSQMREKKIHSEDRQEKFSVDELGLLRETEGEEQQYQHNHNLRRSDSVSIEASEDDTVVQVYDMSTIGRKSSMSTRTAVRSVVMNSNFSAGYINQASITPDASGTNTSISLKVISDGLVQQREHPEHENTTTIHDTAEKTVALSAAQTEDTPKVFSQVKKRTRKKTTEVVALKSPGISETHSPASESFTCRDEIQRKALCEIDNNTQSSQDIATTTPPPPASTSIPQAAQTPTKDSKKGPDQHSPLHSGKVPYRVGLSRKRKIAPLLKTIKK